MAWVRVDDSFYDHPKFQDAGPLGLALWVTGLAYCNRNQTDGVIAENVLQRLVDFDGLAYTTATIGPDRDRPIGAMMEDDCAPFALDCLIQAGLVHANGHDCPDCDQPGRRRLIYHDYRVYQPTKAQIEERRAQKSDAGRQGAEARWGKADAITGANTPVIAGAIAPDMADGWQEQWQNDAPNPNPNPSKKNTASADAERAFEEWYETYPRKRARPKARAAYLKAIKSTDPTVILAGLERDRRDWEKQGTDPKFIPHPATWLNQERWADETASSEPSRPIRDVATPAPPGLDAEAYAAWYAEQQRSQR